MQSMIGLGTTFLTIIIAFWMIDKYAEKYVHSMHFICPYCGKAFKLSKFNFVFALKTGRPNERIVTCPYCGQKDRMPLIYD